MSPGSGELETAVESVLDLHGYELVELRLIPRGRSTCVQVLIDHRGGGDAVRVGDCARMSRALRADPAVQQALPEQHVLEVSSPGIDRPLTRPAHYRRFRGDQAVVRLRSPRDGRRTYTGVIGEAGDSTVTIVGVDGGDASVEIAFADILSAHLKVDPWKRREKH